MKFYGLHAVRQLLLVSLITFGIFPDSLSQEYFQQEVNYKIHVTLNDMAHELNAFETIEYINNSPDTLRFLYFHLWPNGYANNSTPLAKQLLSSEGKERLFNDPELKGYIDSLDFKIDNRRIHWNFLPGHPDICQLWLTKSLTPGDTIKITTPFHVKIPKGVTSRLGHIGQSYQISQWYPKLAVYDRSGWHQMSYLDQGEFYSEFGNFDVNITLPDNYIVAATGNLQNDHEMQVLDKLAADTTWKLTLGFGSVNFPPSSEHLKTLRYTGSHIHDFAWFADKRFHVLKGKVKLPDSDREVPTWVMFTNQQAELWKDALKYVNNAIWYFSNWNGDYPYQGYTAVQSALNAGEGMEYPGVAVIGLVESAYRLDEVIAHEVCHSWFYAALGSDERRYPFMDEGMTSAYERRYMNERYPGKKLWEVYFKNRKQAKFLGVENMPVQRMRELEWLAQSRQSLEQPLNLQATDYSNLNYSLMVYDKAAAGYNYLRAYLGDSLFDTAMHDYYQKWKFKHPQPNDLQAIFELHTSKDLSWFFSDFLGTTKRIDYKIVCLKNQQLLIKNKGEMAPPLVISGMNGDSITFEKWVEGFEGEKWIDLPQSNFTEIKIDPKHVMPELYRLNNNIRKSGIFRRADPVRFQLLCALEDPDKRTIIYTPSVNWNEEDGFMVGLTLHNGFLIPKPLEYLVMPFVSFKHSSLAGYGRILYNITPYDRFIRLVTISLEGTKYGAPGNQNYYKAKTGLDLYFKTSKATCPFRQRVFGYYFAASDMFQIELLKKATMSSYLQFGHELGKTGLVNPFKLLTSIEFNKSFQKISVEFHCKLSYNGKGNGLNIRLFGGSMLKNTSNVPFYAFAASGRGGREQYLYEGWYPDRFTVFPKTFFSRQMALSEGGLVSPVNDSLGYSRQLLSLSLTSSLPGKISRIPIKPFVNLLWNDHGLATNLRSPFFCEAGIKAGIWNVFEIYIPLLVTKNIKSVTGSVKDRIRIVLNLDSFNQLKLNTKGI